MTTAEETHGTDPARPEPARTAGAAPGETTAGAGTPHRAPAVDADMVLDFVGEGLDYLDRAQEALLLLEKDPADCGAVDVVFRAFHTIKGVSAFMELADVSDLAHEAETLLAEVRDGTLDFTGSTADLLLCTTDVVRALLDNLRTEAGGGTPTPPGALPALRAVLRDPALAERVARGEPLGLPDSAYASGLALPGHPGAERRQNPDVSVRIRTDRLDELVDLLERLSAHHGEIAGHRDVADPALQRSIDDAGRILLELQELGTSLRMVPLRPSFKKISRIVRDVGRRCGKAVELVTFGEEIELDRVVVTAITDSLVHMVRNSIDHGLETAAERRAAGKSAHGTVRLSARRAGGDLLLEIEDDGRGLDRDALLDRAVARGLVGPDDRPADDAVFDLVFHPGLSTATRVTDLSGRGVGMDVVRRAVESLRGRIEIESERGGGTKFSIRLPLALGSGDGPLAGS